MLSNAIYMYSLFEISLCLPDLQANIISSKIEGKVILLIVHMVLLRFTVFSASVLVLGKVGELEVPLFSFFQMPYRITNVQFSISSFILANSC
jgi:hypothetical protein